jgi:hypothetical protein
MRTRLLGFAAALMLAALSAMGAIAQAATDAAPAVDRPTCEKGLGRVQYDPVSGIWICVGGTYNGESIN